MASHLGLPLQLVKHLTTTTELIGWMHFIQLKQKEKIESRDKWEHYAASIISEIRRSYVKNPTSVKTEDFYHTFSLKPPSEEKEKVSREKRIKIAKKAWGQFIGINLEEVN